MKNEENYHTFGTVLKSKRKIVERGKISTSNTNTYTVLTWYILLVWTQTSPFVTWYIEAKKKPIANIYRSTTYDNIYTDKALHA
jgi:hypothetical protein